MCRGQHPLVYLRIEELQKSFGKNAVLQDVSLAVQKSECFGISGHSGCGKTTLLRIVAGLESPDAGTMTLGGLTLRDKHDSVSPHRRKIGFVFQDLALWPHITGLANVAFMFPGRLRRSERKTRAKAQLEAVRLPMSHIDRYPDELSGGEQQRVAIARALAGQPRLLLMDEPFAHLDKDLKNELFDLVSNVKQENQLTILYVSHVPEEVERLADRIGVLKDGRIQETTS